MTSTQQFVDEETEVAKKKGITQARDRVNATITNQTPFYLTLLKSNSWSGNPETFFPKEIAPNESATFTHLSNGYFGSRGVVVYAGLNATALPCAWLLAWNAPAYLTSSTPNRVYVDCGQKSMIDEIDWTQIDMHLQTASEANSHEDDTDIKTTISSKFDDKIQDPATLKAKFGLFKI